MQLTYLVHSWISPLKIHNKPGGVTPEHLVKCWPGDWCGAQRGFHVDESLQLMPSCSHYMRAFGFLQVWEEVNPRAGGGGVADVRGWFEPRHWTTVREAHENTSLVNSDFILKLATDRIQSLKWKTTFGHAGKAPEIIFRGWNINISRDFMWVRSFPQWRLNHLCFQCSWPLKDESINNNKNQEIKKINAQAMRTSYMQLHYWPVLKKSSITRGRSQISITLSYIFDL